MTNPVMKLIGFHADEDRDKICLVWCPGCDQNHPFRIYTPEGSGRPTWTWNGDMEKPTFGPSLLCYHTICVCPPTHQHWEICQDYEMCQHPGHAILNADGSPVRAGQDRDRKTELRGHHLGHVNPMGNCHSFLRDGVWEFLGDSAHSLAGQSVPMVPLPDWMI